MPLRRRRRTKKQKNRKTEKQKKLKTKWSPALFGF
jgi:hypothetical protein